MILSRHFYARPTVEVARDLRGKILTHGECSGLIIETEAYLGHHDLAAHSAAGLTERTRVIFGPPGHAYVYLSYGIHECFNIVAEPEGQPGCVLIRALAPLTGLDLMRTRRPASTPDPRLAAGPGNLTRALNITRQLYGHDLTRQPLSVHTNPAPLTREIEITPRIGITKSADLLLRFMLRKHPSASR